MCLEEKSFFVNVFMIVMKINIGIMDNWFLKIFESIIWDFYCSSEFRKNFIIVI